MLHVAAAVLRDRDGRILLTRRTAAQDHAGCWEFPGGKVEPGESPRAALDRELDEELGIRINGPARPLMAVPQLVAGRRLLLDVYEVDRFEGRPHGREGQLLRWVERDRLFDFAMPPADLPVAAALRMPACYAITPEPAGVDQAEFLASIDTLLGTGVRRLQLRSKRLAPAAYRSLAAMVQQRVVASGGELLINDSADIAAELGCGLHLSEARLFATSTRPLDRTLAVAASCHDARALRHAEAIGVDFVVLGPVRATATHPDAVPIGWAGFAALRATVALPIYALGGLDRGDLAAARAHGAQGIAAIRGLWR